MSGTVMPDPAQGMNLEQPDGGQIVGPAPVGTEPAPPAEPREEYPEAVEVQGKRLVPVDALHEARERLKAAQAKAQELEQAAARAGEVEQQLDTLRPVLARLRARPDIVQALMAPAPGPPPGPQSPYGADPGEAILPKPAAEDLARTLELYTPEGTPDLARARKVALFMRQAGGEEALRVTAPVSETVATNQAGTLRAQYSQIRDKQGRTVNPQILQQMFNIVPAKLIAEEPNVAGVLYYAAKGYAAHHGLEDPAPPPRAPLVSEASGGRTAAPTSMSELDRAFQKALQVSEKQYTEAGARYKPGAINVLE